MAGRNMKLRQFESRLMEQRMDPFMHELAKKGAMTLPWTVGKSHSCHKQLDELKPISLGQMFSGPRVYRDSYLPVRVVSEEAYVAVCTEVVVEDVHGAVENICFYNFDATLANTKLLKAGTIMLVKEPHLRLTNMTMERFIRVDSPSDVIFVSQWDKTLLEQAGALCWYKPEPMAFDMLKKKGNEQFGKEKYEDALHYYDRALAMAPSETHSNIIHLNRAAALLSLGRFDEAYEEAEKALDVNKAKALYRMAKSAYGIRAWPKALALFEALVAEFTRLDDAKAVERAKGELERAKERLAESKTGQYDQGRLFSKGGQQHKFHDMADHIGPVKVTQIPGKGMGLVLTEDVQKGRLLVASKAYSMVYLEKAESERDLQMLTIQCIIETIQKMHTNAKSMPPDLYALYAGPKVCREKEQIPAGLIDAKRIELIVRNNSFFAQDTITNAGAHYEIPGTVGGQKLVEYSHQLGTGLGLWLLPSFINHACLANCFRYFCGDLLFIYALCDLKCGEEVTISYLDPFQSLTERQTQLAHQWNIKCDCNLCALERADPNTKKRTALLERIEQEICQVPLLIQQRRNQEAIALLQSHATKMGATYAGGEEEGVLRLHLLPPLFRLALLFEHAGELTKAATLLRQLLDDICSPRLGTLRYQNVPMVHAHLAKAICAGSPSAPLGGLKEAKRVAAEAFELFGVKTGMKERKLFVTLFPEFSRLLVAA